MKSLPEDFETAALIGSLAEGWGFEDETADFAAVGGGSYHWVVTDVKGSRGFVTVDDLDQKPWLGDTRSSVFEGLRRAFATAGVLRESGLPFVIAPIPTSRGQAVRRIGLRYAVALFPFVDGQAGVYGEYDRTSRAAAYAMLAELHAATPAVASVASRMDLALPGRRSLESALRDVNHPWSGGPFSEQARRTLARHAHEVTELLALVERLSADVARSSGEWVVTHGEPHAANVMRTDRGHVLIDWDTVAIAPPERDLWMLLGDGALDLTVYTAATGHELDQRAVDFFRLRWDLADIAAFTDVLRSPHRHNEDAVNAVENLRNCLAIRDQWAAMLG